jgi:hypothetical protein
MAIRQGLEASNITSRLRVVIYTVLCALGDLLMYNTGRT